MRCHGYDLVLTKEEVNNGGSVPMVCNIFSIVKFLKSLYDLFNQKNIPWYLHLTAHLWWKEIG